MDQERLKQSALELEDTSRRYAETDPEAKLFAGAVEGIIADVKAGKILAPMDRMTGLYKVYFFEGTLQKYRDLETAFANFDMELSGGETPEVRAILDKIAAIKMAQSLK
ncbi:hypothetical protein [Nitrospirillum viridazoti]|uniref:Uncharacterized protein n=1 Tax=Nitrospirillum amazonense TaxID=28077 RepID=A0A560HZN1_9PROT|nr:hypothetical protein [Nitrospirillum amazonense]TWB51049.1 hypothetical protein FBZ92_122145 [Nitrospirillum amazonense]